MRKCLKKKKLPNSSSVAPTPSPCVTAGAFLHPQISKANTMTTINSTQAKHVHTQRIPSSALAIILASSKRTDKAKAMIKECMVVGTPYNQVAISNGCSRQYVSEICRDAWQKYLRLRSRK